MSGDRDLKAQRPVRYFLAVTAHRVIWWPAVGLAVPFVLIGAFVDWLSWTALPWVAKTARPLWSAVGTFALTVGNRILGYEPDGAK
jgi:hypothetical protein